MPLPKRKVEASLRRKGFVVTESDHRVFRYVCSDGRFTRIRTKTSHGASAGKKDLDDTLLALMAEQCKLDRRGFADLVNCPMSQEDYESVLRAQGII